MNSYEIAVNELTKMNNEYGDVWRLPPYKDCLMFVMTEIGEAFDALMRQNPAYFRNRDFSQSMDDFYKESCDIVMMAIKALMSINYEYNFSFFGLESLGDTRYAILSLCNVVAEDLMEETRPVYPLSIETMTIMLIMTIEDKAGEGYVGRYMEEKMNKTRAKIEAKKAEKSNEHNIG